MALWQDQVVECADDQQRGEPYQFQVVQQGVEGDEKVDICRFPLHLLEQEIKWNSEKYTCESENAVKLRLSALKVPSHQDHREEREQNS